jgi:hypothetical protein
MTGRAIRALRMCWVGMMIRKVPLKSFRRKCSFFMRSIRNGILTDDMSKTTVLKLNAKLSAAFGAYAAEHPNILKNVPKDACIVFATTSNQMLTKINKDIAKEVRIKENKQCFVATHSARGWSVVRLK